MTSSSGLKGKLNNEQKKSDTFSLILDGCFAMEEERFSKTSVNCYMNA
jgi:hypothetical protein